MGRTEHNCELEEEENSVFPYMYPNAPFLARIKRGFQKTLLLYEGNPSAQFFLRSSAAITFEKRRHARSVHWYIIHPFSKFRSVWEVLMIVVLIVALVEIPFMVAFFIQDTKISTYIGIFSESLCLLDVLINFFTGYYEHETKEIVLNPLRIAVSYLRGYFFLDLISAMPLYELVEKIYHQWTEHEENSNLSFVVNSTSLLKLFRVRNLLKYMKRFQELLGCQKVYIRITHLVIVTSIFFHWWACIHYIAPLFTYGEDLLKGYNVTYESWIAQSNITFGSSLTYKYVNCLLRAVSNAVTLGYGHMAPRAAEDVFVVIGNMLSGTALFIYLYVVLIYMISAPEASKTKYQEVMNQLQEYMTYKKLNNRLQRRMRLYYRHRLRKTFFREKAILATVSSHMREEILLHCCQHLVENVVFFVDVPKIIIYHIVSCLKHDVYLPNDVVMKAGAPGDCMYFIASGTVAIFSPMGKELAHVEDNGHFGEVALVMEDDTRTANAVAIETCELYRLDRKDFDNVITPFPELRRRIERIAAERVAKTFLMEDEQRQLLLQKHMYRIGGTVTL